jgi:hypothetical protein
MRGRTLRLSAARRIIADLMYFGAGVPGVPAQRTIELSGLRAARAAAARQPRWSSIFAKAYGVVSDEFPELRRVYLKYPWPRLYEYPTSTAMIAVERRLGDEDAVLGCTIKHVGALSLLHLSELVDRYAQVPIQEVTKYRRLLRIAALPLALRRPLWMLALNIGRQRANHFGTFAVTSVGWLGADLLHPVGPWTTLLTYGPLRADGTVEVRIIFDHRVLDGATAARALARLEEVLNGPILDELRA